ncbi:serine O-acetyltransferase [Phototrophicus methaneseepsis]|uniref:Serine acetyltransferase n=1 Tax=Phototrophicus methaneseepsis TaxID=2710758 RepID=A0A7S8IGL4_9CHLR|nr:serine O-acetyltransferase EpsC [Phototrophicus methaneseepsis]QPC84163.1 serine O-acetyltransferase [Phototrophicus methaneseepsis]
MWRSLREDVACVFQRDPAARSRLEVILFYPGLHAIWLHRVANWLWHHRLRLLGRGLSQFARWLTGIEIHPGATLGPRLFIDHGMGVVIGETAEVGADVTIYHGVTLGGVSLSHGKRHPTIEDNVVIGAGAKVLGAITVGENSRIGANAVVVKDVEPEAVVVGVPGKVVKRKTHPIAVDLQHDQLPDVLSDRIDLLLSRLQRVEELLRDNEEAEEAQAAQIDYMI